MGKRKRKAVPGDVCEFALDDGRYAYGPVLRDASIAVYRSTSTSSATPPIGERDFVFTVGVFDDLPGSMTCPIVGHDPSRDPEEDWPPPYCVTDKISGRKRDHSVSVGMVLGVIGGGFEADAEAV